MTSLVKKIKKGRAYYYAVRSARVDGKPRVVWQKYLGTIETILEQYNKSPGVHPAETALFEAGGVAALLSIANRLGIMDLINENIPKRGQGPTVGHYILLASLNRALAPLSKSKIGDWYNDTVLQRLWNFSSDAFTSQNYWNQMDLVPVESIKNIQDKLAERVREKFEIDTQPLLFDSTNFFTFIDTHNDRNTIAQRGHNKQKRTDLRQVNLSLLTTSDFQIPLFHSLYQGDIPDVKNFPDVAKELLKRHDKIFGQKKDATLVFDKGNMSEANMEQLLHEGLHFVGGVKADFLPEVFSISIDKLQIVPHLPGTKIYETPVEILGRECHAVLCYSESFFAEQLNALTTMMSKCQDKLKELQASLIPWTLKSQKKPKGAHPTMTKVRARIKTILSGQHMKEIFSIELEKYDDLPYLRYAINSDGLDRLMKQHLGRTLLITNNKELLPPEVVSLYRSLEHIEGDFKYMKNRDYLRWQPSFHWTDQKLEVHTWYCVLALLLVTLARKVAHEAGLELSAQALLDDLSSVREVVLLYPDKDNKLSAQFTLSRMNPRQKKLIEAFGVGEILAVG
jgi:transposase